MAFRDVPHKPDQGNSARHQQASPSVASSAWQEVVSKLREEDKTPLVRLLLQDQAHRIEKQAQRISALEAEITQLKGGPKEKPRVQRQALRTQ